MTSLPEQTAKKTLLPLLLHDVITGTDRKENTAAYTVA
jgi:hypothetical protein